MCSTLLFPDPRPRTRRLMDEASAAHPLFPTSHLPATGFWLGPAQRLVPPRLSSKWERTSRPLAVGARAKEAFRVLGPWMRAEAAACGDADMSQEADILDKLAAHGSADQEASAQHTLGTLEA